MKLRTVRTVFNCLLVAALLLLIPAKLTQSPVLMVIAGLCAMAALTVQMIFWKCPACGHYLGRHMWGRFCRHCGEDLDMYE